MNKSELYYMVYLIQFLFIELRYSMLYVVEFRLENIK